MTDTTAQSSHYEDETFLQDKDALAACVQTLVCHKFSDISLSVPTQPSPNAAQKKPVWNPGTTEKSA